VSQKNNKYFLLTVDVEDWFQVENFKRWIPFSTWNERELRVERNVHRLLDLFDSVEVSQSPKRLVHSDRSVEYHGTSTEHDPDKNKSPKSCKSCQQIENKPNPYQNKGDNGQQTTDHLQTKKVHATFFVLGWIAEKLPHLVHEIQTRGHEVASHGFHHNLSSQQSPTELKLDLTDSKKLLEDRIGAPVMGYRAPSFAISDDILKTILDCDYIYDSSYNSFGMHGRYGQISLNGTVKKGIANKISDNFYELPISNLMINRRVIPWGGGGYFRLIPYLPFKYGVKSILKKENAYLFFMHPWEIDPEQPKVKDAFNTYKFRHYVNLRKTRDKLFDLINDLSHCRFITCSQYLSELV
jgi:polysaccharide deacetylase family protein (PEP-CTERM system associated)